MKGSDLNNLIRKYILPKFPGYFLYKTLLVKEPINLLIQAHGIDRSGWNTNVIRVVSYVVPTYIPIDVFGTQIGKIGIQFDIQEHNIEKTVQIMLSSLYQEHQQWLDMWNSPEDIVNNAQLLMVNNDLTILRYIACSYIFLRQKNNAMSLLNDITKRLNIEVTNRKKMGIDTQGLITTLNENNELQTRLMNHIDDAIELLLEWRDYTLKMLKFQNHSLSRVDIKQQLNA